MTERVNVDWSTATYREHRWRVGQRSQFNVTNGHTAASVSHRSRNTTSDSCIFQRFPFRLDVETPLIVAISSPTV